MKRGWIDANIEADLCHARLYAHARVDLATARACHAISEILYNAYRELGIHNPRTFDSPLSRVLQRCNTVNNIALCVSYERDTK